MQRLDKTLEVLQLHSKEILRELQSQRCLAKMKTSEDTSHIACGRSSSFCSKKQHPWPWQKPICSKRLDELNSIMLNHPLQKLRSYFFCFFFFSLSLSHTHTRRLSAQDRRSRNKRFSSRRAEHCAALRIQGLHLFQKAKRLDPMRSRGW